MPTMQDATGKSKKKMIAVAVLCFGWMLSGITAFVASLFCFARSGTMREKVLGLLIAILTGPFFWAYVLSMKGYCRRKL